MSPANIEEELRSASPLIGQAVCIGDARPFNVALLVLDADATVAHGLKSSRHPNSPEPDVRPVSIDRELSDAVRRANDQLSRVEQIKRYHVFHDEWPADGEELTPTMKLKRRAIAVKYAAVIEDLYRTMHTDS